MLGDILREEREKQNLTVKDVEMGTSIRALYISAIEENNYDVLPGEVYLKGFIKTYADFLNLDGSKMVDLYKRQQSDLKKDNDILGEEIVNGPKFEKQPALESTTLEKPKFKKNLLTGFAALVVIGGIIYLGFGLDSEQVDKKLPVAEKQVSIKTEKATEKVETNTTNQMKGVAITAKYTGDCWTQIEADNKTIYEGTAKNGDVLSWQADNTIVVRVGNAGAVEINHNGKNMGKLGSSGDVVTKKFTNETTGKTR
jgi:cytoskeletal protein RodZ